MFTRRAALALAASALTVPALAQAGYPNRPVRMIVPFPPGGSTDVLSRVIAERLGQALGQQVVVENRPGSAGNVGVNGIARAEPDGYTIGVSTIGPLSAHVTLYRSLPFDPRTDFTYLADIYEIPNIFVVPMTHPARSIQDWIAWARTRPAGTVSFGTPGVGTTGHLGTEFFARRVGLNLLHVPYRTGSVAVQDLIAGRIDFMFDNLPTIIGQIQGNQIRALAVSTGQRWPGFSDVPTMIEGGVADFDVTSWSGMLAPRGIPGEIAQRLTAELIKIGEDPSFRERYLGMGAISTMKGPDVLRRRVEAEIPRWAEVVNALGLKVD